MGIAESLYNLGELAIRQGQYNQAHTHHSQSLVIRQKLGDRIDIADSLEGLAALATTQKELVRAARLLGAARSLREEINVPTSPAKQKKLETAISHTRPAMGEKAFAKEWDKGRALTLDEAIDYALKKNG